MPNLNDLFPSKYLRASDLKGRTVNAVIERVTIEDFENDGRMQQKPVVYFKGGAKGLVTNKTNALTLASISGSEETDGWAGTSVTLFPAMVAFQGRVSEAIRIGRLKSVEPVAAPEPAAGFLDDEIPF